MLTRYLTTLLTVATLFISGLFYYATADSKNALFSKIIPQYVLSNLSDARKEEIRIALENTSKFLLFATGKSEEEKLSIFAKAQKYLLMKMEDVFYNYNLESLESTDKAFRTISKVPSWTLKDEIDFMTHEMSNYENLLTPEMLKEFDQYLTHMDFSAIAPEDFFDPSMSPQMQNFVKSISEQLKEPESRNSKDLALNIINNFEQEMNKYVERIRHLGDELTGDLNPDVIKKVDPRLKKFLQIFINEYYQHLSDDHLKNILSDFISLGPNASKDAMMQAMINNSGPTLGKSFQQLAKEPGIGESIGPLLESLESSGKKVPFHLVDKLIKEDTGGYQFLSIDQKPLGTGTVAQVHKAKLLYQGKEIDAAVRFIKPGTKELADQEMVFMKNFIDTRIKYNPEFQGSNLPDFEMLLNKIQDFVQRDLNIEQAIERQKLGKQVYDRTEQFTVGDEKVLWQLDTLVPAVYPPEKGQKTQLHVQEFITFGKKFSEMDTGTAQELVGKSMFSMWFEEALFKSGYTHYDLHQGNFTVLVNDNNQIKLYIFDYGMTVDIPKEVQRTFLLFAIGAQLEDARFIRRAINLSNKTAGHELNISQKELLDVIKSKMEQGWSSEDWVLWAVKNKYLVAEEIGALARGGMLIRQLPKIMGDETYPKKALLKMAKTHFLKSLWDRSYTFPLTNMEKLMALKSGCVYLIRSFF